MSYFRAHPILLATCLFLLVLPQRAEAQERDSLLITYTIYTRTLPNNSDRCQIRPVGSHPNPVGNGSDSDYYYPLQPVTRNL